MSTDAAGLYRLMAWLSPSYPVGAFTLSHGLEWVVEDGVVADADRMVSWVGDVLAHGAGRQDAILLAAAYRARRTELSAARVDPPGPDHSGDGVPAADPVSAHSGDVGTAIDPIAAHSRSGDPGYPPPSAHSRESGNPGPHDGPLHNSPWIPAFAGMSGGNGKGGVPVADSDQKAEAAPSLAEIIELAAALNPSLERRTETLSQGDAFRKISADAWPASLPWPDGPLAYPVAVAIAAADHRVDLAAVLVAYLHAFAANIVSAGVRLIPLGQTDGQRAIVRLEPAIAALAEEAAGSTLDDLGGCALLADIASMRHETQYTRLFRT
ncbi:urease accessory protein UreF [Amorphus orientalis]|uniref:Urease accessory protein UreF n=1 Tax=Amorphus orientalis TaxID=649198 RepID=A0AAE3VNT2_9HYPH|nr:urease accessory UreF family protein [Amorphus orientalis]MDQ0315081.1 urease accessory protein UreF [Amorphus orientalis]